MTSTTARAASASISYPKNYGTGSTQIRHEPAGTPAGGDHPPVRTAEYRSLPRWLNPTLPSWPTTDDPSACSRPAAGRSVISRVVLSGLFIARPASAATSAPAASAATAAPPPAHAARAHRRSRRTAAAAAPRQAAAAETTAKLTEGSRDSLIALDGGVCSVPVVGDIGGLVDLCKAGVRHRRRPEQHLHAGTARSPSWPRRASTR